MLRPLFLYSLAAAEDSAVLLQLHHVSKTGRAAGVEQLLSDAKTLASRVDKNRQNPIRQCDGGWQTGDGTGGSEQSVGSMSRDACVAAARDQCSDANGASYDTDSQECFCEVGQSDLDSSTAGRVNCRFFADGTTNEDMETAVDALATLVENMIAAMDQEHRNAQDEISESGRNLDVVNDHISHHSASTVETLEIARDDALAAHSTCLSELSRWTTTHGQACPAWESHVQGWGSTCQGACPCNSGSATFYSAAQTWWSILGDGGWAEIDRLKGECDEATTQMDHYTAACPPLGDAAALAEAAYQAARSTHVEFCGTFADELGAHESRGGRVTASLTQRRDEYDILQQVSCYIDHIRDATENSQLLSTTCPPNSGAGLARYTIEMPNLKDAPRCLPAHVLVMKLVTETLHYANALWENTETLNPFSAVDEEVDAKYQTFMTTHFNTIILCVGGPSEQCITHPLQDTYNSAHDLFTAGSISYPTIPQSRWLTAFEAEADGRANVGCPMQSPGFNIACRDGNRARFGYCNNVHTQSCNDRGDSDATIGIGLDGQNGGDTGAGHTCYFAANYGAGERCSARTIPTWFYVDMVRPTTQPPVLIMKAVTTTLHYANALWENLDTLNPDSPVDQIVDAKYAAFMSARFNSIRMCAGGPTTGCINHRLPQMYDSAHALFTAGYIEDASIDQGTWLTIFEAEADGRSNVRCPMQSPGFNIACRDGNRARFGWCNNIETQSCADSGDSDATIGIGLDGQNGGDTGAGHTCYFAADYGAGERCSARTIPTWIYVEEV